ncbi:MAG: DinB family protein [Chloroflexota bacterium]
MIIRPQPDEYAPFYGGYINRVPEGADLAALLARQPGDLQTLLSPVSDQQANARPKSSEWSIKEMLGHICDAERVFAYRATRFARNDNATLPGFDQDEFVKATDFNTRTLADLLEEFSLQRRANLVLLKSLTAEELERVGTASGNPMSSRAAFYVMAGHVLHHVESLRTDYHVGA